MTSNTHETGQVPLTAHSGDDSITAPPETVERVSVQPKGTDTTPVPSSRSSATPGHGPVRMTDDNGLEASLPPASSDHKVFSFAFFKTKRFWIVLLLSQVLAVALTGTNTFTGLLARGGTSIPAFQTLFNYILLNLIYTSITIYKLGFKEWIRLLIFDGWKFFILAFLDVEGNYFTIYAYQYTILLSAQLLNFWAIVMVVIVSLIFLKVRYHLLQYLGILICCGGLAMLLALDRVNGGSGEAVDAVKGNLFALLGATFYGLSNVYEEFMVSKRPLWLVVGQLAFWAQFINAVQVAIFDRGYFQNATWEYPAAGYLVGYTLILSMFYSLAPVVFRMASAAFFNIGLLTSSFWGLWIGLRVFEYTVTWWYPVTFVLILGGLFIYYMAKGVLGEARKPWLGEDQADGVAGVGTARRKLEHPEAVI